MDSNGQPVSCGTKCGPLPDCAPLAVTVVPGQTSSKPKYESDEALARGTLFPGLDLPLGNIVNSDVPDVPLAELMALDFAAHDLSLYLDTHPSDQEAFETYKDLLALSEEGKQRYARLYGPICKTDLKNDARYTWMNGPWPWEYVGKAGK